MGECAMNGMLTEISMLFALGQDVNQLEKNDQEHGNHLSAPLHYACGSGYVESVELLLKLKADPNLKDRLEKLICTHLLMIRIALK
jgi:ankyrin repeat protein